MFKRFRTKGVNILVASIFACLLCSVQVSAISVEPLERISDDSEFVEILEPEEGYDFDVNFIAKNQVLTYKTTLTNDEEYPIRIDGISLNESAYDFLEYSFEGLEESEKIESGEARELIVSVNTNSNDTVTVEENYNLVVTYTLMKPDPVDPDKPGDNPETSANSIIKTGTVAFVGVGALLFVFVRNKRIRHFAIAFVVSSLGVYAIVSTVSAEEAASTLSILGKVRFTNIYNITVNPNGGTYEGELTATRREGEKFHIDDVSREHFEFVEWEINPTNTPDENNDIEIHADTTIKAKWNENTYTLTIKPNGGEYLGSTEDWSESYRPLETATISTPEMEGYDFVDWTVEKGSIGQDGHFDGSDISMAEDITLVANYQIKTFTVTVIPNGGIYHESTDTFTTTVDWNTDYEIESISRDGYDLKNWTKIVGEDEETLTANTQSVNIKANTTLEANWWSSTWHTVTIIPNGGIYDGKTEQSEYRVRDGEKYTMLEATSETDVFDYWHYTDTDTRFNESEFVVTEDLSLTAEWLPIVAQIIRNGEFYKYYPSIMAAHEEAIEDDIIELLVDTTEIVTNSKKLTLDLGTHTVTGYLTNTSAGNLTLINGIFDNYQQNDGDENNPNGAAVINNGTLTLGVNDYEDDDDAHEKAALIDNNYVQLYGNAIGMQQNGTLNYYDGIIEGEIGLVGGYSDSPWYRTMDEVEDLKDVHYYPFVSRNTDKDQQHIQLNNSNLAVSKTIDDGAIYYYDLQDNINTSVVTGYKIYAVRDFTASYDITIPANKTIELDIDGYQVSATYNWTNNGTFSITDSKLAEGTGYINYERTFNNNSVLNLSSIKLTASTSSALLINKSATLNLENAHLIASEASAVGMNGTTSIINADNDSVIETLSTKSWAAAVDTNATNAIINGGTYKGPLHAIYNANYDTSVITINDGVFTLSETPQSNNSILLQFKGHTIFNGGKVYFESDTNNIGISGLYGTGGKFTMNGGSFEIKNKGSVTGMYLSGSETKINSGLISIESSNSWASGISDHNSAGKTILNKGGDTFSAPRIIVKATGASNAAEGVNGYTSVGVSEITVSTNGGSAAGVYSGVVGSVDGASITVSSVSGEAYGISEGTSAKNATINVSSRDGIAYGYKQLKNLENSSIVATSENNNAYGGYVYYSDARYCYSSSIKNNTISSETGNAEKVSYGFYSRGCNSVYAKSGTIDGTTAGIFTTLLNSSRLYIGENDGTVDKDILTIEGGSYGVISDGPTEIYDGTMIGATDSILNRDKIVAIAEGTEIHTETIGSKVNTWLKVSLPYLYNTRLDSNDETAYYNSFSAAYGDSRFQNGDTLQVTRDYSTEAKHPNSNKTVTIDLNSHTLSYYNAIKNSGTMTITDNSEEKKGKIIGTNDTSVVIENTKNLTVKNVEFSVYHDAIYAHESGNVVTIENVKIKADPASSDHYYALRLFYSNTTLKDSIVEIEPTNGRGVAAIVIQYGSLKVQNSKISAKSSKNWVNGIEYWNGGAINFESGEIYAFSGTDENDPSTYKSSAKGISSYDNLVVGLAGANNNDVKITAIGGSEVRGISQSYSATINSGTITAISKEKAYGIAGGSLTLNSGIITANSINDVAYGLFDTGLTLNNGLISSYSEKNASRGFNGTSKTANIKGGRIEATEGDNNANNAIAVNAQHITITSGEAYGADFGFSASKTITLGSNDETSNKDAFTVTGEKYGLYSGDVYFYDGTIIGGPREDYDYIADRDKIKAIAAGTGYNIVETAEDTKCWLIPSVDFLYNVRLDKYYNSFAAAYSDELLEEGDTLRVVEDNSNEASIPDNTHTLTLDLNGKTLIQMQAIKNSGTLTITDGKGGGVLQSINPTESTPAIYNSGTLNINGGTIVGARDAVYNINQLNMTGGTVKVDGESASVAIRNASPSMSALVGKSNITGGTIEAINPNDSVVGITLYGESSISNATINIQAKWQATGISRGGDGSSSITISGNTITTESSNGEAYGISVNKATIQKDGNKQTVVISTGVRAVGISGGSVGVTSSSEINDALITVTSSTGDAYGISNVKSATGNTINVTSTEAKAYGFDGARTINSNVATVSGKGESFGVMGCSFTVESGTTTVNSSTQNAYGYKTTSTISTSYNRCRDVNITGGNVSATTDGDGKLAYGFYANAGTSSVVTGGTITGEHYGIFSEIGDDNDTIRIGTDDGVIYNGIDNPIANPIISGGMYGVVNSKVSFYDGKIRGATANYNRNIKAIATDSYMHMTSEDGYGEVKYVSATEVMAKIGSSSCEAVDNVSCFPSIQKALDAAQSGETVTLVKDNYVYEIITAAAETDAILELDGHKIISGNPIRNYGKLTIQNSTGDNQMIDYLERDIFITNYSGGDLTLRNLDFEVDNFAENKSGAKLTLDGVNVSYVDHSANSKNMISNYGELTIQDNSSVASFENVIYHQGSKLTITDSAIENTAGYEGYFNLKIAGGATEINNSTIKSATMIQSIVQSVGTTSISDNSEIVNGRIVLDGGSMSVQDSSIIYQNGSRDCTIKIASGASFSADNSALNVVSYGIDTARRGAIDNSGTLSLTNETKLNIISSSDAQNNGSSAAIYNTGEAIIDNSTITLDLRGSSKKDGARYGIYNSGSSSSVSITNGSLIDIDTDTRGNTYGIYVNNSSTATDKGIIFGDQSTIDVSAPKAYGVYVLQGKFVMGVKENTQNDTSSKQWPLIKAISSEEVSGATGIGMIKENGIFNFYDGKIVGSTHSRQSDVSETEYWCDVIEGTDENGYEYSILRYLPSGNGD